MATIEKKKKLANLLKRIGGASDFDLGVFEGVLEEVENIKKDMPKIPDLEPLKKALLLLNSKIGGHTSLLLSFQDKFNEIKVEIVESLEKKENKGAAVEKIEALVKDIDEIKESHKRLHNRRGGGSMNRHININGVDYLTRYTDINLIGSITAVSNDATKQVDITFTGGGFTELIATGAVNGINPTFIFAQVPSYIVSDGAWYKKLDNNGGVNWSNSGTTITMTIPPQSAIFGIA